MIEQLLDRAVTVLEAMAVDDARGAPGLRHDPSLGGAAVALKADSFRRFSIGLDASVTPDHLHETPNQQPTYWTLTATMRVFYPIGQRVDNLAFARGLALDDATRIIREIPRRLADAVDADPITGLSLIGGRASHQGLTGEAGVALVSDFVITVRFARSF